MAGNVTPQGGVTPPASNPLRKGLVEGRTGDACAVVIFGASGDLTRRKLMPALYNLAISRALPGGFAVVGQALSPAVFGALALGQTLRESA